MLPVVWDVTGVPAVIVGGGPVGRRKAATLHAAGAEVRVIDPCPTPVAEPWPRLRESYRVEHLAQMRVVVAAATAAVNAQVVADATAAGLWVSSASDPSAGNFVLPAVLRRGPFTVAVSTGGAGPAFARRVRDELAERFDPSFGAFVDLLAEMRRTVRRDVAEPKRRRELLNRFAEWQWLDRFRREGHAATRAAMEAELHRPAE